MSEFDYFEAIKEQRKSALRILRFLPDGFQSSFKEEVDWLIQEITRLQGEVERLENAINSYASLQQQLDLQDKLESLQSQLAEVMEDRDELKHKLTRMPAHIQELEAENAELKAGYSGNILQENIALKAENAKLKERVEELYESHKDYCCVSCGEPCLLCGAGE